MAYTCKLYLKEECDGCGCCMGPIEDDDDDEDDDDEYDFSLDEQYAWEESTWQS